MNPKQTFLGLQIPNGNIIPIELKFINPKYLILGPVSENASYPYMLYGLLHSMDNKTILFKALEDFVKPFNSNEQESLFVANLKLHILAKLNENQNVRQIYFDRCKEIIQKGLDFYSTETKNNMMRNDFINMFIKAQKLLKYLSPQTFPEIYLPLSEKDTTFRNVKYIDKDYYRKFMNDKISKVKEDIDKYLIQEKSNKPEVKTDTKYTKKPKSKMFDTTERKRKNKKRNPGEDDGS